eukprot:TRINITY_DN49794_c0_g1_i1.p2 TRINITY_DN49794_c0_g1~~TRINITY_DN49794_c0_g1_i1.p2  ORF type:complete len:106 (-),score=19.97 TRINITY_DN49794_c0_g1_i1:306-623(-)
MHRWAVAALSGGTAAGLALLTWYLLREAADDEEPTVNSGRMPGQMKMFEPTLDWQEVPDGVCCPRGLEIRMDMSTGKNMARVPPPQKEPEVPKKSLQQQLVAFRG